MKIKKITLKSQGNQQSNNIPWIRLLLIGGGIMTAVILLIIVLKRNIKVEKGDEFWWTTGATIVIGPFIQAFLQFIFQVFFTRHVDREIAKLREELEKDKNLEGKIDKLSEMLEPKAISLFRQMHIDNSKPKSYSGYQAWRLLSFGSEHKREYDDALEKMKEIFDTLELNDNDWSFVVNCAHEQHSNHIKKENHDWLTWKKYKEFLQKSGNSFDYFDNLWKNRFSLEGCCREVLFWVDKLNYLCFKTSSEFNKKPDILNNEANINKLTKK